MSPLGTTQWPFNGLPASTLGPYGPFSTQQPEPSFGKRSQPCSPFPCLEPSDVSHLIKGKSKSAHRGLQGPM